MPDLLHVSLGLLVSFIAATLAAVAGFGGAAVLLRPPAPAFAGIGAGASFLSALLGSVGPLMAPFFLPYGLVKGAYIGTEALSTLVMHVTKLVAYLLAPQLA
jgi:hypothetical protein